MAYLVISNLYMPASVWPKSQYHNHNRFLYAFNNPTYKWCLYQPI